LLMTQARQGGGNGGGMMGEVVVHRDAFDRTPDLHAAFYALESIERLDGLLGGHPYVLGGCQGGEGIALVVGAAVGPVDGADGSLAVEYLEVPCVGFAVCAPLPSRAECDGRGP